MGKLKKATLLIISVTLLTAALTAQVPTGKIVGKIVDDQGLPLPGVAITARCPKLLGTASAVTDREGTFRLFALPSGTFSLNCSLDGFNTVIRQDILLQLEQTITVNITMTSSTLEEEVTVVGQSPIIDVKSTVKGKTLTRELFASLPKGRNFDGLISIIPGVQMDTMSGGLSVDGATGTENMWYVDGTDVSNMSIGTRAQSAVFELVDEVQVKASGYAAEFGGSMGGVVNVITRSGGNSFHGDMVAYYNDYSRLMYGKARDYLRINPLDDSIAEYVNDDDLYFDGGKNRDNYYRMEGLFSLGGYILKDRLWFFGSFNPIYHHTLASRVFLSDPEPRPYSDFKRKDWNWNGQFKLTAQPLGGLRISASFVNNFYKYRGTIPSLAGGDDKTFDWGNTGFDYPNWSANLTADYILGNNLLLSLRGGFFRTNQNNQQQAMEGTRYYFGRNINQAAYPEIPDSLIRLRGWRNYYGNVFEYVRNIKERINANFDLTYYTYIAGEHAFKAGAQYIRMHADRDSAAQHPLVNLFWGIPYTGLPSGELVMGTYGYYAIVSGFFGPYGAFFNVHTDNWALYLQDSWTIADKLTLQVGLRAESEYLPSYVDPEVDLEDASTRPIEFGFGDKLAPRFGAIYDVFGDSSLKIFANFALYYDVMKLYVAQSTFGGVKYSMSYYELNDYDWTKIAASGDPDNQMDQEAGNRLVGSVNYRLDTLDAVDPNLRPTSQREITFGFEKKLLEELALSVRVVNKHLIRTIEDVGIRTAEGESYYYTNPGFGLSLPISQGGIYDDSFWPTPKAKREYWGVNISLDKRFSNNWQGGINYTWSRLAGNYSGLSSTDELGINSQGELYSRNAPNMERSFDLWFMSYDMQGNPIDGPLQTDRTHYIKAYGSYAFPFGLTVGVVGYGRSGVPLQTRLSINRAFMFPYGRGDLGRMPFTAWANLYLEYNLRIGAKYNAQINLTIDNFTNTDTWQIKNTETNRISINATDEEILSKNYDWESKIPSHDPNPMFMKDLVAFPRWQARLGFRFSF